MNDDTISALGGFCTELLSNEAFDGIVKLYSQQCAADILNTQGHEAKKRESIYAAFQGFEGFLALIKKLSVTAEGIAEQHQQTVDPTTEEDDPGVHDIYRTDLN